MNAPLKPTSPAPGSQLTTAIVLNIDILRDLAEPVALPATRAAWAARLSRDPSNLNKTLKALAADGALANPDDLMAIGLTDFGRAVLRAVDLIDGKLMLPEGFALVDWARIEPNPDNPRKDFDSPSARADFQALKASIAEYGVRMPPEVYPADAVGVHRLLTGERRWRAVRELIQEGAVVDPQILVRIKDPSAEDAIVLTMDENIQRRNLSYTEEAQAYRRLIDDRGWTDAKVAERFKRSKKHVQDYLRLLTLPRETLRQLEAGEITYRQARDQFQDHRPSRNPKGDRAQENDEEPLLFNELKAAPATATLNLTPKQALLLAEVADKAERFRPKFHEQGWTAVTEIPVGGAADELARMGILLFTRQDRRSDHGGPLVRVNLHSTGACEWLVLQGFYENPMTRGLMLFNLRREVVGHAEAAPSLDAGYETPWLNTPEITGECAGEPMSAADEEDTSFAGQIKRAAAEEPGSRSSSEAAARGSADENSPNPAVADAKAVAALAELAANRLGQWRADPERAHWSTRPRETQVDELAEALYAADTGRVAALLAVLTQRYGALGVAQALRRSMHQCLDKDEVGETGKDEAAA